MISKRPSGMFAFTIVWIGQAVSLLGTSMSAFALTIWAYELTGKATALALAGFTVIAGIIFHGNFADQMQSIMFMKNLSIAGGLI